MYTLFISSYNEVQTQGGYKMENQEIMQALEKIAIEHSTPFCYGC